MNDMDSKTLEEVEAAVGLNYCFTTDNWSGKQARSPQQDERWLISTVKEQDREIERLRLDGWVDLSTILEYQRRHRKWALHLLYSAREYATAWKQSAETAEIELSTCKERVRELEEALYAHRADLHCYSSRPCPTCRNSAEVLGISDKVPYCCAQEETDSKARHLLAEKEKV